MIKLILNTQYFWPETFQINSVAENLAKKKNVELSVLTGLPNYPKGEIFRNYRKVKKLYIENYKNIKIYRCPIIPRKDGSFFNLVLNYVSFVINGLKYFNKIKFNNKINYILTYSTSPITANLTAIFLKKKHKTKLAIWLQDLWPESVEATGHIKNKFILFLINYLVKYILNQADIIFVPSKKFIKYTKNKTQNKKIIYLPNTYFNHDKKFERSLPRKISGILKYKKCFVYSGNIGKAQNIDIIINAANNLRNEKKIFFILIGDGSEKKNILKKIKKFNLNNILIIKQSSFGYVQKISKKACGLLLPLKDNKLFNLYIPNKFQNYLKLKKPIIAAINGEVASIIKKNQIGLVSKPTDVMDFAKNIIKVSKMSKNKKAKLEKKCQILLDNEYSQSNQINMILKYLK